MITFSPTAFRANSSEVFNAVQANRLVSIESKSRPDMILMLRDEHDFLLEEIRQLSDIIKSKKL